jgi:hypothetical protein
VSTNDRYPVQLALDFSFGNDCSDSPPSALKRPMLSIISSGYNPQTLANGSLETRLPGDQGNDLYSREVTVALRAYANKLGW